MNEQVIDCCSLINLHTGLRGLGALNGLARKWYVCDAVLAESQYTREFGGDGVPMQVPLTLTPDLDAQVLHRVRPESEQELSDYVDFAADVDDGEAQALAIAKNRGFVLLTDDNKAQRLAAEVGVRTTTTVSVLRDWGELSGDNKSQLPEIVQRITVLARFAPATDSADYEWWKALLDARNGN